MEKKKGQSEFFWGVTQIGQQVEGNCTASNWSAWARRGLVPPCGIGNDYWQRFAADHDLVEELGVSAMRMSIDWARIEPEEGKFDENAIAHYHTMLTDLKRRNIKTVVGLWHYTVPMWFEEKHGMHHKHAPKFFDRFAEYVCDKLGDQIDMVVVLNEPMVYIGTSYLTGERPPFLKSPLRAWYVLRNLIKFHTSVYKLWKKKHPEVPIGSTHLWNDLGSAHGKICEKIAVVIARYFRVGYIIQKLQHTSDFIGINYYTSDNIYFRGLKHVHRGVAGFHGTADWHSPHVWRDFPAGLTRVLLQAQKYQKPLYVLENGKPTNLDIKDHDRQKFLVQSVAAMKQAQEQGADVRGYFHYALADAYEWTSGYDFTFGLVEVDRGTLKRTKRQSFDIYKKLIKEHEKIS